MTYNQVKDYFEGKGSKELCPLTNELIQSGYQQKSGGYIKDAKDGNSIVPGIHEIEVDYRKAEPNQWWHLMNYCCSKIRMKKGEENYRLTPCGELIFWMAEVSEAVDKEQLSCLVKIIKEMGNKVELKSKNENTVVFPRRVCNRIIKEVCWQRIKDKIEAEYKI